MAPGGRRLLIYEADHAADAIDLTQAGIDNLAAIMPILDALRSAPKWGPVQAEALAAAGRVITDLAADVGHRARLLTRYDDD